MKMFSKMLGMQPRIEICACTVPIKRCFYSAIRCDWMTKSGTPYTDYVDCTTREICRTTIQGGCCYD